MSAQTESGNARKRTAVIVFLGAYALFALVFLRMDREESLLVQLLLVGLIGLMAFAVIRRMGEEDEVRKAIISKANATGFWVTLLFLMAVSTIDGIGDSFGSVLPFWSVPIVAWLAAYGIVTLRYR